MGRQVWREAPGVMRAARALTFGRATPAAQAPSQCDGVIVGVIV